MIAGGNALSWIDLLGDSCGQSLIWSIMKSSIIFEILHNIYIKTKNKMNIHSSIKI